VTLQVNPADVAEGVTRLRLDAFLSESLPSSSRAQIQEAIKQGGVTVNGVKAGKAALALKPGDVICCTLPSPPPLEALPEVISLYTSQPSPS
jgi:23S rRNA pseudouridine1911/1915/1917 synthase